MIYHITTEDNVNEGKVVNPLLIKHGVVTAMRISGLSGWVDPSTHLNLDFPKHIVRMVIVADRLEMDGRIMSEGEKFSVVLVEGKSYRHYGMVDEDERLSQFKKAVHKDDQLS
jgi:DNA topoisomerase VI subunit A